MLPNSDEEEVQTVLFIIRAFRYQVFLCSCRILAVSRIYSLYSVKKKQKIFTLKTVK